MQVLPSSILLLAFDGFRGRPFHGLRLFSVGLSLKLGRLSTLPLFDRPSGFGYQFKQVVYGATPAAARAISCRVSMLMARRGG